MDNVKICDTIHTFGDAFCPGRYELVEQPPSPQFTKPISKSDVYNILKGRYERHWQPLDKHYTEVSIESLKDFLKFDEISETEYISEKHDCDNFAIELAGQVSAWAPGCPFGIVFLNGHAINCFIYKDELYFVEPQSDKVFKELDDSNRIVFIIL
jgi:hypothetical protein